MKNINILKDLKTLNELHSSSVESHTTNNGIVDFACDNAGYVDNVAIEGKTLVNLCGNISVASNKFFCTLNCKPTDGVITFFNKSDKLCILSLDKTGGGWSRDIYVTNGFNVVTLTNEVASGIHARFSDGWTSDDFNVVKESLIVLKGDHTDKPISYFEGLKSVGQGDKIEVLTRNQSNKNLFYGDVELGYIDNKTGVNGNSVNGVRSVEYIKIDKNTTYTVSDDKGYNVSVNLYGENKSEYFGEIYGKTPYTFTTDDKTYWIRLRTFTGSKQNDTTIKWQLEKGNQSTEYAQPKYDKKLISTTLRSLPNGVKDTIEKRGNKYVKVQRCGEVTLNGTEQIGMYISNGNTAVFGVIHKGQTHKRGLSICDKFRYHMVYNTGEEHFYLETDNTVNIEISLSRLSSANEEGFKTWLKSNPTTVVYELETPIITELPNFNPQTYKGDNTFLINSGAIQCDASFDVYGGIRSELDEVKDKVSSIHDIVVEDIRETRHYPTLQNGWVTNSHDYTPTFVKFGNLVTFNMRIKGGKWSSATIIVDNLPEEFRVKSGHAQVFPAIDLANDKTYNAIMYKEGHIKLYGVDAEPTGGLAIMGTYYVN